MSTIQWRVDYRYQGCIGLSIAGFAQSEAGAKVKADLLSRLALYPISEIQIVPVSFKARGRGRNRLFV